MLLPNRRGIFVFILLCNYTITSNAQTIAAKEDFDFNDNCKNAYDLILALQLKKGATVIEKEKAIHPQNLIVPYLQHLNDFMIFFVEEKDADYEILNNAYSKRLSSIEKATLNSPWKKYLMAEMNIQMAICNAKLGNFIQAFFEVKRANALLKQNQAEYPQFILNLKSLGLIHCLIGTIPQKYKWGASLLGFQGTLEQGMNELYAVKNYVDKNNTYCKHEVNFILVYGMLYIQNNKTAAYQLSQKLFEENSNSKLYQFLAVNVAQNTAHNDQVLHLFSQKNYNTDYLAFEYLDYMQGMAHLKKLQLPEAIYWLEKFSTANNRKNFVKDGYQKLAWAYLLNGNIKKYEISLSLCRTKGHTTVDADKQALREVNAKEQPNILLLKARLLSDGGYYERAIGLLHGHKMEDFVLEKDKVEFVYRAARIYHEWGYPQKAIPYYLLAIKYGEQLPHHYACNAALQMGIIYEEMGNTNLARKYYNLSIQSKNSDFKDGLEQKARTALERLDSPKK